MVSKHDEIDRKIRAAQSSIASLSIFIALSAAMIGFLLSQQKPITFGYNATAVCSSSLAFAIVLFLVALEFFILCIYRCEHVDWFGLAGSCLYGLGAMWMVVGISVAMTAFGLQGLSFMFLSATFLGYLIYYILRMWRLGREDRNKTRIALRCLLMSAVITGYVFIATLGG